MLSTMFTVADLEAFSSADLSLVSTYVDAVWMQALPSVSLLTNFLPLGEQGSNEIPPRHAACLWPVARWWALQLWPRRLTSAPPLLLFLAALAFVLFLSGVQRSVVLVMKSPSFRSTWPIHLQRLFVMGVRSCLLRSRFLVGDFYLNLFLLF